MTRTLLLGDLPVYTFGPNKNRLNRLETAKILKLTNKQLHKAYNNWIQLFKRPNTSLTFLQYIYKMKEAKITPDNLGNKSDDYHLARYTDEGPYTNNSCRFITKSENLREQKENNKCKGTIGIAPWNKGKINVYSEKSLMKMRQSALKRNRIPSSKEERLSLKQGVEIS